ncbi:hypothetical protein JTE90_012789 [Oedothorax gibbosus]|uniref:Uncharacterized protein n=1 Tax=Oedothorax gibbosus TaxID=931172 RepID=A0AAV6W0M0_9ARAC|nr:hypothetical protein JTE90_012789 [Oedothorax gibbosus]
MQASSINEIEGKLCISSVSMMTLNTRFSLYRYKTFYIDVMRKLYNRRRATIELQNHMKKRRTVLLSNEQDILKVSSTGESSTSTSRLKEKLDTELDKYMSEVINSTAELSCSSASSSPILQECVNEVDGSLPASTGEPSTSTSRLKEKLDTELDKYMSEVINSTAELSCTSACSTPILQECVNEVDGSPPASNNRGNADIICTSEFETYYGWRNDKEPTKEDLDRELDEYMAEYIDK